VNTSLNSVIGGTKDADIDPVECMGPISNSLGMVGLVGNRDPRFDTFIRVENWGYKRPRER